MLLALTSASSSSVWINVDAGAVVPRRRCDYEKRELAALGQQQVLTDCRSLYCIRNDYYTTTASLTAIL
jgi:hypothetical protein